MDPNNPQNIEAPQFSGANLSPQQPQPKSNKIMFVLIGLVILVSLVFFGLKYGKNSTQNLSENLIKNSTYYDGTIKLVDGYYAGKDDSGKVSPDYYTQIDSIHPGDLNGDNANDAVVILSSRSGGTGVGRDVAFVLNQKGEAVPTDTFSIIDDRSTIKSIDIQNSVVIIIYAPWDGGNGIDKTIKLKLNGNKIQEMNGNLETTSSVNADWKTYTNTKYGFKLSYPSKWDAFGNTSSSRRDAKYTKVTSDEGEYVVFSSLNLTNPDIYPSDGESLWITRENGEYFIKDSKTVDDFWAKLSKNDKDGKLINKFQQKKTIDGIDFIIFQQYNWNITLQQSIWEPQALFMYRGNFFWVKYSGAASKDLFDQIVSTFKFTGSSEKTFLNTPFNLEFTLPDGYIARSNHYGITDPTKAENFDFVKEKHDLNRAPILDVSTNVEPSAGQSFSQFVQYVYSLNKDKKQTTTDLKQTSYGGVTAYEFGLQNAFTQPIGGQLLYSSGAKVVFLQHSGKTFKFLLTGDDSGLVSILRSLKFINKNFGSSDWKIYTNTDYNFQLTFLNASNHSCPVL